MERLIVNIPDLTCACCVPQIEQVMRQQEGVIWAMVNFAAGEATIIYDPPAFRKHRLIQAVRQLGVQIDLYAQPAPHAQTKMIAERSLDRMQRWMRTLHLF